MAQRTCSVDGCERPHRLNSLCRAHYKRLIRTGSVGAAAIRSLVYSVEERLARYVDRSGGCWLWTGGGNTNGYGATIAGGQVMGAHRMAWMAAHGPIPDGMFVCHRCDVKLCVKTEPDDEYPDGHLFLGTTDDNMADMVAKGRHRPGRRYGSARDHVTGRFT